MDETKTLYECRSCTAISGHHIGGCASCGYDESTQYMVNGLDNEPVERTRPWYRSFDVTLDR